MSHWDSPGWKEAARDYHRERESNRAGAGDAVVREPVAEAPLTDGHAPPTEPQRTLRHTAATLKNLEFAPLNWIVPRYFPEGVTLLAGKPKVGKSWLALAIALAVTRAAVVLDQTCQRRVVLYYALEDTRRRMQERIGRIMPDAPDWPENLVLDYELPPLENGGMAQLQTDLVTVKPGLIIIDTLGRVRGSRKGTETEYQWDTRTMGLLHDFGRKTGVAIIVVHHLRKQTSDDVFDTFSGTHGLTGVADTLCALTRLELQFRLAIRGRDVEPEDKILDFDGDTGVWNVTGDYEGKDPDDIDTRRRILDLLESAPMPMKPLEIAKFLNLAAAAVRKALRRMKSDNVVKQTPQRAYYS